MLINTPIHIKANASRNIVGAASKAKITIVCANTRIRVKLQIMLVEIEHLQLSTLLELNNITAFNVLTSKLLPERSKDIDMKIF